jgi:hypothetical protein
MEANVVNDAVRTAVQGYTRAEVDEFLQAAAAERSRLESEIADARSRIGRARSAIGMHRVMVAMLLETQRELTEMRAHADVEAEAILAQAERDAAMILAGSAPAAPGATTSAPPAIADPASTPIVSAPAAVPEIDLSGPDPKIAMSATGDGEGDRDEYFDFLRGALADESPLGPGAE